MTDFKSNTEVEIGTERSFGIVFAAVFIIIAFWPTLFHDGAIRLWAITIAVVFAALGIFTPRLLKPVNRIWFHFGNLLGKIVAPIVMGLIFFVTVTPIGLIRRVFVKDPLNEEFDPEAQTYWITKEKDSPVATSMRQQF